MSSRSPRPPDFEVVFERAGDRAAVMSASTASRAARRGRGWCSTAPVRLKTAQLRPRRQRHAIADFRQQRAFVRQRRCPQSAALIAAAASVSRTTPATRARPWVSIRGGDRCLREQAVDGGELARSWSWFHPHRAETKMGPVYSSAPCDEKASFRLQADSATLWERG